MKALKLTADNHLELAERDVAHLAPDAVAIDIVLTGICGTDIAALTGRETGMAGIVRGHEAVGMVARIGSDVTRVSPGMRVVIDPNEYCGGCARCVAGRTNLCLGSEGGGLRISGVNQDGTFTETYVAQERFVYQLPDAVSWEAGVLIEPLACVLHNIAKAGVVAGEHVLLLGSGPMSLVAQLALRHIGARPLAVEINAYRIEAARALGLNVVDAAGLDKMCAGGRRFDVVIDTVGNQLQRASDLVDLGGRIVLFGFNDDYRFDLPAKDFLVRAVSIIGAGEYNQEFSRAISVAEQLTDLGAVVSHRFRLEEFDAALLATGVGGPANAMKVVFTNHPPQ